MKDNGADLVMIIGRWYKIRHRPKNVRHDHLSVMQYLGVASRPGPVAHKFTARPVAGIRTLPNSTIISVEEVPATTTPIVGGRWPYAQSTRELIRRAGNGARKRAANKAAK